MIWSLFTIYSLPPWSPPGWRMFSLSPILGNTWKRIPSWDLLQSCGSVTVDQEQFLFSSLYQLWVKNGRSQIYNHICQRYRKLNLLSYRRNSWWNPSCHVTHMNHRYSPCDQPFHGAKWCISNDIFHLLLYVHPFVVLGLPDPSYAYFPHAFYLEVLEYLHGVFKKESDAVYSLIDSRNNISGFIAYGSNFLTLLDNVRNEGISLITIILRSSSFLVRNILEAF